MPPGPSCAGAEPQSNAGTITVQGPGFGPVPVQKDATGKYILSLPAGTIQPGTFTVQSQGATVGAFTTSLAIPESIQLTTMFPPGIQVTNPLTITLGGRHLWTYEFHFTGVLL